MRRAISLVLAGILVIAIVAAVIVSRSGGSKSGHLKVVHGVIGSEKQPYFDDPRVVAAFRKAGFDVEVDTAGSRAIATTVDLSKYDFAFPAGTPAALKIQKERKISQTYVPFFTPMAVASFKSIARLLESAGVAHQTSNGWSLDMRAFLALTNKNTRWSDLKNNSSYPVNKSILITSTDIQTSNSAAMYASIASYVANGENVVASSQQAHAAVAQVEPLFTRQGFAESSSEAPFDDYISIGKGKTPLVMIYESQFVDKAAQRDGSISSDMVLLYPDPDILSKHTLVPLTANGDELGRLLSSNKDLQQLAIEHGFRTSNRVGFQSFVRKNKIEVAPDILNIVEPPTYETLEAMIVEISRALHGPNAARL